MSAARKKRSPRLAPRAGNRKAFDVRQQYSSLARSVKIFLCRLRLQWAVRAIDRPFDSAASLRLDRAVISLETALEDHGGVSC